MSDVLEQITLPARDAAMCRSQIEHKRPCRYRNDVSPLRAGALRVEAKEEALARAPRVQHERLTFTFTVLLNMAICLCRVELSQIR